MGRFLRDELIKNVTLDEGGLSLLDELFIRRANGFNTQIPNDDKSPDVRVNLFYIIRFDNKGYRLYSFDEVLRFYRQAKKVERVIFLLESYQSLSTNGMVGTRMELRLDSIDAKNCTFVVSSDDADWIDSSFTGVQDILSKYTNKNRLVRNAWFVLLVQIFGVTAGFILSLWAAVRISPHLTIESPFVFSFIFAFLLFANVWTYLNQQILRFGNYCFPNVRFQRKGKDKLHWLLQAILGGVILAATLYLLNWLFSVVGGILSNFIVR